MNDSKTVVGIDIAKRVFQLHWIDQETGEIMSLQLKREKFLEHFANRVTCLIGMEACGSSQHWARKLTAMGHHVKLIPAKAVRPFVGGNKNDAHDARAIWIAVQQPTIKAVAVKSEEQQAILALHRMRQQLVKFRTAQINGLRGLLTEYGEVMPKGKKGVEKGITEALQRLSDRLPAMVIDTLREQWRRIGQVEGQIGEIERRLKAWQKEDLACQRIAKIPGVGLLTATAAVATMGDARVFKSGREFAAWLGLVPRQTGTGGRIKLLGISKRGDTYLRTMLIHGARAALTKAKDPLPWAIALRQRRPLNVAIVAMANKMARTIWALLAYGRTYQKEFVSRPV
ncbi:MAG: IS110 family transposase [Betaproteobacteria bacterium]|nr:IS110 family transposase [Betaproteobacteria bacterium]